jgi:hypothetical protein
MEWIGIGIAIATGFYVAPFVIAVVTVAVGATLIGICQFFGGCK